ncbi:MAG TPA: hypothetical protein VM682_02655 [Bacillus sp. (in: firmicutes)]|jgi:hypothetical protein|nr:hypothetical protein [Bacillus sp. (in: firmicutes)]
MTLYHFPSCGTVLEEVIEETPGSALAFSKEEITSELIARVVAEVENEAVLNDKPGRPQLEISFDTLD